MLHNGPENKSYSQKYSSNQFPKERIIRNRVMAPSARKRENAFLRCNWKLIIAINKLATLEFVICLYSTDISYFKVSKRCSKFSIDLKVYTWVFLCNSHYTHTHTYTHFHTHINTTIHRRIRKIYTQTAYEITAYTTNKNLCCETVCNDDDYRETGGRKFKVFVFPTYLDVVTNQLLFPKL